MSPLARGHLLLQYRIQDRLGSGGMGEVYSAYDLRIGRPVALKLLPAWLQDEPDARERFRREARSAFAIRHPNLMGIYAFEEVEGRPLLVMELVEGESLRTRVKRDGPVPIDRLTRIGSDVASALAALHGAGIIHRDVKSDNIVIADSGEAKLVDLGLAKRVLAPGGDPDGTQTAAITASGVVPGTAAYMSPEQARGAALDARTDVFSLGVVLYESATGRLPFEGSTVLEVLHEIALVEPPAPSRLRREIPQAFDRVVARAMTKDLRHRFASAAELAAALQRVATGTEEQDVLAPIGAGPLPRPSNLEDPLTSFVGRIHELEEVARLLPGSRLVTLTGPGGSGKSRLAIQVSSNILESYEDGAWLVELAPLSEPGLVNQAVASTLRIREEPGSAILDTLLGALAGRRLLLILDNCEHLAAACAELTKQLLQRCPRIQILATSREPLGVPGETVWRVPPLSTPAADDLARLGRRQLSRFESVRLFVERAARADPRFVLTDDNAPIVASLCVHLDGIPLAIELAAARVRTLPISAILDRLKDRFRLLADRGPGRAPRQQTLRAAIDWSYETLADEERALLLRSSVFSGSAGLEALETVCSSPDLPADRILDLLAHLADKSLLIPGEGPDGGPRYRMLETIREYALEKRSAWRDPSLEDRHASYFVGWAKARESAIGGSDQVTALGAFEAELPNLRAAIQHLVRRSEGEGAVRLCASLGPYWLERGRWEEGSRWMEEAIAVPGASGAGGTYLRALHGAAALARGRGHFERAKRLLDDCLRLALEQGEARSVALALKEQGNVADDLGDHDRAFSLYQESLSHWRTFGDDRGVAGLLHNLGMTALESKRNAPARAFLMEALQLHRKVGNRSWEAMTLNALGGLAWQEGRDEVARDHYEHGLALQEELGQRSAMPYALRGLGHTLLRLGDHEGALTRIAESLRITREMGDQLGIAVSLESLSAVAADAGAAALALELLGAADGLRQALGTPATASDQAVVDAARIGAEERLSPDEAGRAFERGRLSLPDAAIDRALRWAG